LSPPPAAEATAARLQAEIRYAASSTIMLRWALIALVGGPVLATLFAFLGLCASARVGPGVVEAQLGPVVSGTLFLCVAGTGTALSLALPIAAGFRALLRARLRRQLARLSRAELEAALLPLRRDASADTRKIVEPLLHDLAGRRPNELAPAGPPPARGSEASPAG
jgi:hypothetical protein